MTRKNILISSAKIIPVFVYFLIASVIFYINFDLPIDYMQFSGVSLTTISFVLWIMARIQLGKAFTVKARAKRIVSRGIYSKIRHPVYLFSSLSLLGIVIFLKSLSLLLLFLVFVFIQHLRAQDEERVLIKKFGKKYLEYKSMTWL